MMIAILYLSDIHLKKGNNLIMGRSESLTRACKSYINLCSDLIVAISGDIAFSGLNEEYEEAYRLLKSIEIQIKKEHSRLNIHYVIVPGNHDCDFSRPENKVRSQLITLNKNERNIDDAYTINILLSVQENFYCFLKKIMCINADNDSQRLSMQIPLTFERGLPIVFNCYNSSLLSELEEKPGSLNIPHNSFLESHLNSPSKCITVSIFHHTTSWLNPNNIKQDFESHILKTSQIILCGHEHTHTGQSISEWDSKDSIEYIEGGALQYGDTSEYSLILIDNETLSFNVHTFEYEHRSKTYEENVLKSKKDGVIKIGYSNYEPVVNDEFLSSLQKMPLPISHPYKNEITLNDVFVYPDLDPYISENQGYSQYIDSSRLLDDKSKNEIILLQGESQIGKTALLRKIFIDAPYKGLYPLLIDGGRITSKGLFSILQKTYKTEYDANHLSFDAYMRLDKEQHILVVDDFDKCTLNKEQMKAFFKEVSSNFNKVIVTTSPQNNDLQTVLTTLLDSEVEASGYTILSFGHYKRNQLIEKWIALNPAKSNIDEAVLREIKLLYDEIQSIIGKRLIPSYPIFLLTLLSSIGKYQPNGNFDDTAYAFCYNCLITVALANAENEKIRIKGLMTFLREFCYELYMKTKTIFSKADFINYYKQYSRNYSPDYNNPERMLQLYCESKLFHQISENCYEISYKYIFYYFIALKISCLMNDCTDERSKAELLKPYLQSLYKDDVANIIIILTYLNSGNFIIDELKFVSMLPFENCDELTLGSNDIVYKELETISKGISNDIVLSNPDPKTTREYGLKESDTRQRFNNANRITEEDFLDNPDLCALSSALKIIKILGQIVKNQIGSAEKTKILDLIESSYRCGFRTLMFTSKVMGDFKDDLIEYLKRKKVKDIDAKTRANKLVQILFLRNCLHIFSMLSSAVGTTSKQDVYLEVANTINTPAAKIVSFTINSYYNKLNLSEMENILHEFKSNFIATQIVKARIRAYVYNNILPTSEIQKICEKCDMKYLPSTNYFSKKRQNK